MDRITFINYWKYLIFPLEEQANQAKDNFGNSKEDFDSGHLMAYYHIFESIKNQAHHFRMDEKELINQT